MGLVGVCNNYLWDIFDPHCGSGVGDGPVALIHHMHIATVGSSLCFTQLGGRFGAAVANGLIVHCRP